MNISTELKGIDVVGADTALALLAGFGDHEHVDVSSADVVPTMLNCRGFHVDTSGIIKFDFTRPVDGATMTKIMVANAGIYYPQRHITKVYRYYKDTTACTATSYNLAGVLTVGMHLGR